MLSFFEFGMKEDRCRKQQKNGRTVMLMKEKGVGNNGVWRH